MRRCVSEEETQHILAECHDSLYGGQQYILLAVDYVSKWLEAVACARNDACTVSKHKITTTYHPQTNGQAKVSNQEIKSFLEKVVNATRKDWAQRLDEALWAYRTAYKTPIELEHKAFWTVKKLNMNLDAAGAQRKLQLNELEEWRLNVYEKNKLYKEKTKRWHDHRISKKELVVGQIVLLFNSCLHLFTGKLKSGWSGPFIIKTIFPYGAVELIREDDANAFKVSVQSVKPHFEDGLERHKSSLALRESS
ncbi:uncharacterized protein LOC120073639 [Benincasa hispida]|uniref:uncharacterized protein LOC120073639 n=1 Tax=Benincasa hispida TaxID=102211 RepID=UPI0018FF8A69|nr:uncharacterized protein LOC120073639 [Benincasa hispida]